MINKQNIISSVRRTPRLSVIAVALLAMSSTVAIAQEESIEEIIVSGEKIDRTIQDTASSVAVFTQTQIEESAIYDIQEIFDRIANVNSASAGEGFTIRGINDNQVGAPGGSSSLASLTLDGAFIGRNGIVAGQKDLWDVAQIEVFRGPQSTNQGRNALAGAIFIRSNNPTYEADGQYRVAYGTDGTSALSVAFGDSIIEDQLAFRVSIDRQESDGFINNQLLDDDEFGNSSNTTVRGKLLFEPAAIDGLSILTTLSYSDNETGSLLSSTIDAEGNELDPFTNISFSNIDTLNDIEQIIATTEVNYEINDQWSFTSISSYNEDELTRQDDDDNQGTGGINSNNRIENTSAFSQEFRFNFTSEKLRANVGAYYFNSDSQEDLDDFLGLTEVQEGISGPAGIAAAADALNNPETGALVLLSGALSAQGVLGFPSSASDEQVSSIANSASLLFDNPFNLERNGNDDQSNRNYAAFANIEYDFNDFVTVFSGVRYDTENVRNSGFITEIATSDFGDPATDGAAVTENIISTLGLAPFAAASPLVSGALGQLGQGLIVNINNLIDDSINNDPLDSNSTFSAFLPKLGVTLNWTDNLNTSFSVQRAYRAGGAGVTSGGVFEFDPEFTTNFDLSLRSRWLDNRLTVNANLFYVDWEDQQVNIVDPNAVSSQELFTANAGESSLFGLELELGYIVNNSFNVYTNIGYVETEFDDFDNPGDEDLDLTGNEFNNAPELTAAAGFSYKVLPAVKLQADINYQDASFDDPQNEFENDSRTLVNSKITYSVSDALEVAVVGRNIFDREYIVQSDEFELDTVVTGLPRTVLLQLQGKF